MIEFMISKCNTVHPSKTDSVIKWLYFSAIIPPRAIKRDPINKNHFRKLTVYAIGPSLGTCLCPCLIVGRAMRRGLVVGLVGFGVGGAGQSGTEMVLMSELLRLLLPLMLVGK